LQFKNEIFGVKMKHSILFLLCLNILFAPPSAFTDSYTDTEKSDARKKENQIPVSINLISRMQDMGVGLQPVFSTFKNQFISDDSIDFVYYMPNSDFLLGVDVTIYGFGMSFFKNMGSEETDIYGKTEYTDYQFYYFSNNYGIDLYYQKYKGFYIDYDEPEKEIPGWQPGDPYPQRSDMSASSMGFNLYYNFFPEYFSLQSSLKHNKKNDKSGASLLIMLYQANFTIKGDYSLIPPERESYYSKDDRGFKEGVFRSIGIAPGVGFNVSLCSNYFFSGAFFLGTGFYSQKFTTDTGEYDNITYGYKINLKLSTGYESDRFIIGLTIFYDDNLYKLNDGEISFDLAVIDFFAGIRF
jgi:hypothetical protein